MNKKTLKIGIVAPGCRIDGTISDKVLRIARDFDDEMTFNLDFHPQCYLSHGHFAGNDEARANAFLEYANDDSFDAIWFARGGYGACRILEQVIEKLNPAAKTKLYLGYSDAGSLLAALYSADCPNIAHGPMPSDINRKGGEAAITRALDFLGGRNIGIEPTSNGDRKTAAFNITILSQILGTPYQPDLSDHILMLEEISEYMYRIDRYLFHITSNPGIKKIAGIKLGRCSDIPDNDPDFKQSEEDVIEHWCTQSGIPYLGRADIGHDADNKIVPFGQVKSA